mmetsp:Transcript_27966/g.80820  ORF Transcript_27966/g.80820 Transcript_27966/m.80820 type:complete len:189 (+) Transcript_27966:744-1310(+)
MPASAPSVPNATVPPAPVSLPPSSSSQASGSSSRARRPPSSNLRNTYVSPSKYPSPPLPLGPEVEGLDGTGGVGTGVVRTADVVRNRCPGGGGNEGQAAGVVQLLLASELARSSLGDAVRAWAAAFVAGPVALSSSLYSWSEGGGRLGRPTEPNNLHSCGAGGRDALSILSAGPSCRRGRKRCALDII